MKKLSIFVVLGCVVLFTSVAFAESRPITILAGSAPAEAQLQGILNCIYTGGPTCVPAGPDIPGAVPQAPGAPNYVTGQLDAQLFAADVRAGFEDVASISVAFRYSGLQNNETFGLYAAGDPSKTLPVIPLGADPTQTANVTWFFTGAHAGQVCVEYDFGGCTWYNTAALGISPGGFGVYLGITATPAQPYYPAGMTYYSEDNLNPDQKAQVISFFAPTTTGTKLMTWAFEDLSRKPGGLNGFVSDSDFNDMIVTAESVGPVPEPGSMLLLGTGLSGIAALLRRRNKK